MKSVKMVVTMLMPLVFVVPFVHLVRSQYWSKRAKTAWAAVLVLGSVAGYAAFLVTTYNKARKQILSIATVSGARNIWLSVSAVVAFGGRTVALLAIAVLTVKIFTAVHDEQMFLPWFFLAIFGCWLPVEALGNLMLYFGERANANITTASRTRQGQPMT